MGYMYTIPTMYPIPTTPSNLNFRRNPSKYMENSNNAPIIPAFNLAQKRFIQRVNSQKPCTEWGT